MHKWLDFDSVRNWFESLIVVLIVYSNYLSFKLLLGLSLYVVCLSFFVYLRTFIFDTLCVKKLALSYLSCQDKVTKGNFLLEIKVTLQREREMKMIQRFGVCVRWWKMKMEKWKRIFKLVSFLFFSSSSSILSSASFSFLSIFIIPLHSCLSSSSPVFVSSPSLLSSSFLAYFSLSKMRKRKWWFVGIWILYERKKERKIYSNVIAKLVTITLNCCDSKQSNHRNWSSSSSWTKWWIQLKLNQH